MYMYKTIGVRSVKKGQNPCTSERARDIPNVPWIAEENQSNDRRIGHLFFWGVIIKLY